MMMMVLGEGFIASRGSLGRRFGIPIYVQASCPCPRSSSCCCCRRRCSSSSIRQNAAPFRSTVQTWHNRCQCPTDFYRLFTSSMCRQYCYNHTFGSLLPVLVRSMTTLPHRKPGSASKKSSNNNQPLANENLVQRLMWIKKQVGNADIIQVRIVPDPLQIKDEGETKKQATVVVSLTQAIQQALAANKDLVEISIDQDVPVVTIAKVSSIVYHNAKSAKKVGSNSSSSAASILKEVTMQPGIAGGDLQRKVNDILNFIDKGHSCTVTVRAGRRWTRDNENIVHESLERVMALLFHVEKEKEECRVEMAVPPEINEQKSMGKFQVRRVSKRK